MSFLILAFGGITILHPHNTYLATINNIVTFNHFLLTGQILVYKKVDPANRKESSDDSSKAFHFKEMLKHRHRKEILSLLQQLCNPKHVATKKELTYTRQAYECLPAAPVKLNNQNLTWKFASRRWVWICVR